MSAKKRQKYWQVALSFLKSDRKILVAAVIAAILILYLPVHLYRSYSDTQKFQETETAMNAVYASISSGLGRPNDVQTLKNCNKSSGVNPKTICSININFIYPVVSEPQANLLIRNIQKVVGKNKNFTLSGKLSKELVDSLILGVSVHSTIDRYRGPHKSDCSMKYIYNTPDEITLSLLDPSNQPLEMFFSCSSTSVKTLF